MGRPSADRKKCIVSLPSGDVNVCLSWLSLGRDAPWQKVATDNKTSRKRCLNVFMFVYNDWFLSTKINRLFYLHVVM